MATTTTSRVLATPVDEVWALIGAFNEWPRFLSRIGASRLEGGTGRGPVGAVRVLTLDDGSSIRERLLSYDDVGHDLAYEFAGAHPYPIRAYTGRVQLFDVTQTGGTFAYWTGAFDCDATDEAEVSRRFGRLYAAFLHDLDTHLKDHQ